MVVKTIYQQIIVMSQKYLTIWRVTTEGTFGFVYGNMQRNMRIPQGFCSNTISSPAIKCTGMTKRNDDQSIPGETLTHSRLIVMPQDL